MLDPRTEPEPVNLKKEALAWLGGAFLVLAGIGIYLWVTRSQGDLLAEIYAVL